MFCIDSSPSGRPCCQNVVSIGNSSCRHHHDATSTSSTLHYIVKNYIMLFLYTLLQNKVVVARIGRVVSGVIFNNLRLSLSMQACPATAVPSSAPGPEAWLGLQVIPTVPASTGLHDISSSYLSTRTGQADFLLDIIVQRPLKKGCTSKLVASISPVVILNLWLDCLSPSA